MDNNYKRRKSRLYSCLRNGIEYCMRIFRHHPIFLTLTTSLDSIDRKINRDVAYLMRALRNGTFDKIKRPLLRYCGIYTNEGNGVFHAIIYTNSVTNEYIDYEKLSEFWKRIHKGTWNVSLSRTYGNIHNIMNYFINRYISDGHHTFFRTAYSRNWLFKGWRKTLTYGIKAYTYSEGIQRFKELFYLSDSAVQLKQKQFFIDSVKSKIAKYKYLVKNPNVKVFPILRE